MIVILLGDWARNPEWPLNQMARIINATRISFLFIFNKQSSGEEIMCQFARKLITANGKADFLCRYVPRKSGVSECNTDMVVHRHAIQSSLRDMGAVKSTAGDIDGGCLIPR